MILLDTNYLIRVLVPESRESTIISQWVRDRTELYTSVIAWYEFLCGPVGEKEILIVQSLVGDRILPFTSVHAVEAARLYNQTGRKKHLRIDAMIAATAITSNAALATENLSDFERFRPMGLELVGY